MLLDGDPGVGKSLLSLDLAARLSRGGALPDGTPSGRPHVTLLLSDEDGTADTVRCMQRRWSFYHGGVILLIYMDLMALCMILFLLLYPYALWISSSR